MQSMPDVATFANLSTEEKRAMLRALYERKNVDPSAIPVRTEGSLRPVIEPNPADRLEPFPLTPIQESFLVAKHVGKKSDHVGCHVYLEMEETALDIPRLERAWQRLVAHHDVLRLSVAEDGTQRILAEVPHVRFAVEDAGAGKAEFESRVKRVRSSMSHRVYEAGASPLWEIRITRGGDTSVVHLSIDEWIVDGASLNTLLFQFYQLYRDPNVELPACDLHFRDYVLAAREFVQARAYARDLAYWCEKVKQIPEGLIFPRIARPSPLSEGRAHARRRLAGRLPEDAWRALKERAGALEVSPTAFLLTVFAEAVAAHGGKEAFALTLTYFNRPPIHPHIDRLIAPLISTHEFLVEGALDGSVEERVRRNQRQLWRDVDHDRAGAIEAARALGSKRGTSRADGRVVFTSVLSNVGKDARQQGRSFWDHVTYSVSQTPNVDLDHQVSERDGELRFTWDVVDAHYEQGFFDRVFADYLARLESYAGLAKPAVAPANGALAITPLPRDQGEKFPLSELQQAYFVGRTALMANGGVSCQVYQEFELRDPDVGHLTRAWQRLIATHPMLRAVIHSDASQSIRATVPAYTLRAADLTTEPQDARASALARTREDMVSRVFPLDEWPFFDLRLSRTTPDKGILHVSVDLMIADAPSIHLLFKQLFMLYDRPDAPCRAPSLTFRDYLLALRAYEHSAGHPAQIEYWQRRLADLPSGPVLGIRPAKSGDRRVVRRLHGKLASWRQFNELAARAGVSAETAMLGVYLEILGRKSTAQPFTVVVARWDRPQVHPEVDALVGDFTAVSWVTSSTEGSFAERVQRIEQGLAEDRAHRLVSASRILQQMAMKPGRRRDFLTFPVVFTGLGPNLSADLPPGVAVGDQISQTPQVFLDNISLEDGDELKLHWDMVDGAFPGGLVEPLFDAYCETLERLARDEALWHSSRITDEPVRYRTTLHALIEERVRACPTHVAAAFEGEELTYDALNRRANRLARFLRGHGVGPDRIVGVLMDRSIEVVVALLAILKAGGAYLPIDPAYPRERIAFLVNDADVSVLLTQQRHRQPDFAGTQVALDAEDPASLESDRDLDGTAEPEHIAYVIYTSGSTGKPKGCLLPHLAICNRLQWMQDMYTLKSDDRVLQKTPLTFDVSVWEVFWPLIAGATLVLAKPDGHKDTAYLVRTMNERRITTCHFVPSMLNLFLRAPEIPSTLRRVFASGEALTPEIMNEFLRRSRAELHNLYGPTEAAVDVSYWPCSKRPDGKVPIGRAIDNVELHVLDEGLRSVPKGEAGELHIGGVCLARGYLKRPELTREKFIPSPFDPAQRLYKTGDLARVLDDGTIEYLGRIDSQVKLRGFRIELGEVEATLREHDAVRDAVVVVQEAQSEDPKLVAYVAWKGDPVPAAAIRKYLKGRLPEYMVPNLVATLDAIPVTSHGKCDRQALPWPLTAKTEERATPAVSGPSRGEIVGEVQRLVEEALKVPVRDPGADLFDLGATSLTLVRTLQGLERKFGVEVPVDVVLAQPTIDGIAGYVLERVSVAKPAEEHVEARVDVRDEPRDDKTVNFLSEEDRQRFKRGKHHLRHDVGGLEAVALSDAPVAPRAYRERTSQRDYEARPIPSESFARLLGLLRAYPSEGRTQFCYPSAGGTYSVQTYVHVKEGGVAGVTPGLYYFHPEHNELRLLHAQPSIRRSHHFYYNRECFDRAGVTLFFVAQTNAVRPIYGDQDMVFATVEAGAMIQLLMDNQAGLGLGLCPLGGFDFDAVRGDFKLDDGHRYILCMTVGPVDRVKREEPRSGAERTPRSRSAAIVGLAGRYPGASTARELWPLLRDGKSAISEAPAERWNGSRAEDGRAEVWGGFLPRIDTFDSLFFKISPAEAKLMDPQERLFIEVAWECFENAGHLPEHLRASGLRVGVFVGAMWNDYQNVALESWRGDRRARTGSFNSSIANRVSQLFDLRGPSVVVDTSCSSGLTAMHVALRSLRDNECDVALVGAANLLSHRFHVDLLASLNLTSKDQRSRAFSAEGSGWVPGEGVGAVLLRSLDAAEASGDFIHGVLRGTAIGHGSTRRYGVPSSEAQAQSIRAALTDAGVAPSDIDYVECAATGAAMADASEVRALQLAFGETEARKAPRLLGSIKPNIGHLEAASGLSQLTKVLLQIEHGAIAPTIHARPVNPLIQLEGTSLQLAHEVTPWTSSTNGDGGAPRRALINAFGATGSSAHLVVEEYRDARRAGERPAAGPFVFPFSAETPDQLRALAHAFHRYLSESGEERAMGGRPRLEDIAETLQVGRRAMKERLAIVANDREELRARLGAFLADPGARSPREGGEPLAALARSWADGAWVDWPRRNDGTRRAKVPLPTHPFATVGHWLENAPPPPLAPAKTESIAMNGGPSLEATALQLLRACVASTTEIAPERVEVDTPLDTYGLNSALVTQMTARLEATLGRLPRTLFFEEPTLGAVAAYLARHHADALGRLGGQGSPAPVQARAMAAPMARATTAVSEGVAIIGVAGRYPGADDVETFWRNLRSGRDCITEVPSDRWDAAAFFSADGEPGKTRQRWGGFLRDIDRFDAALFNISPREAEAMDPQERLFLETAWCAFEDAGYSRERLAALEERRPTAAGVFVGSMYQHYAMLAPPSADTEIASSFWSIANRVSYFFGLKGPSFAVDAACASSLAAIHLACQSLLRGECGLAIAGGVNLHLHPLKYIGLDRLGLLGSDARSRSLGDGDGYVPGEGVGAVVLKPLADALEDGDRIYAVIKASTANHTGHTVSYGVPNPAAHADAIASALRAADVQPDAIGFVEVAANGSRLGDALELSGLKRAFRGTRKENHFCALGAVKSNIGHSEAASGIAQLTKVICQLKHKELAPTLHADPLNPDIDLQESPFYVQRELGAWPSANVVDGEPHAAPRRALVSSFGAGGAGVHLIVEEHLEQEAPEDVEETVRRAGVAQPVRHIVPLSAQTREQLRAYAREVSESLRRRMSPSGSRRRLLGDDDVGAIAHTLQVGRAAMAERLAVVTASLGELVTQLRRFADDLPGEGSVHRGTASSSSARLIEGREGEAFLGILVADGKYEKIASLWVDGASIDWRKLGRGRPPRVVSLPHYPFADKRYWVRSVIAPSSSVAPAPQPMLARTPPDGPTPSVESEEDWKRELRALLCDTLRLAREDVDDDRDFRSHGMDSRLTTLFVRALQRRFGQHIELTAAHAHPTVRELAAYLRRRVPAGPAPAAHRTATSQPVRVEPVRIEGESGEMVRVNAGAGRRASFWVHGAAGTSQPFYPLSMALGDDYPVFAFQARGIGGGEMPFSSIPAAAAHYIACMQREFPRGPYILGGLSSGGVIAFEMARQLRERGETVDRLVLLDTYFSVASTFVSAPENADPMLSLLLMANTFVHFDSTGNASITPADLDGLPPPLQIRRCVELIKERGKSAIPVDQLYRMLSGQLDVYRHLDIALRSYEPQLLEGVDALFFRAEKGFFAGANTLNLPALDVLSGYDAASPWRDWIKGRMDVVTLPCAHVEMLDLPMVEDVASHVRAALEAGRT